jgi:hypothetical protein
MRSARSHIDESFPAFAAQQSATMNQKPMSA